MFVTNVMLEKIKKAGIRVVYQEYHPKGHYKIYCLDSTLVVSKEENLNSLEAKYILAHKLGHHHYFWNHYQTKRAQKFYKLSRYLSRKGYLFFSFLELLDEIKAWIIAKNICTFERIDMSNFKKVKNRCLLMDTNLFRINLIYQLIWITYFVTIPFAISIVIPGIGNPFIISLFLVASKITYHIYSLIKDVFDWNKQHVKLQED